MTKNEVILLVILVAALAAFLARPALRGERTSSDHARPDNTATIPAQPREAATIPSKLSDAAATDGSIATFAGGAFWCMEPPFDELDGVISTTLGYTGGYQENPTMEDVAAGTTGHVEAVQIAYDPDRVTYAELLDVFWHNVEPTNWLGQFCDEGDQYRSTIFCHDTEQRRLADESKAELERSKRFAEPIVTEIAEASDFYVADESQQDLYLAQPKLYKSYIDYCGRQERLRKLWGERNR